MVTISRLCKLLFALSVFCIFFTVCGCATSTTGLKTALNAKTLAGITSLDVQVLVNEEFTVSVNQVQLPSAKASIEVGVIRHVTRVVKDNILAYELKPLMGEFDLKSELNRRVIDGLKRSGRFNTVSQISTPSRTYSSPDGLLIIKIKNWGLMSALLKDSPSKGQVALEADVSLMTGKTSAPFWERSDYVTGDTIYSLDSFHQPGLLRSEMDKLLTNYSNRIINEIKYAD